MPSFLSTRPIIRFLAAAALYGAIAAISLSFASPNSIAPLIWPVSAAGLAILYLGGSDLWPAFLVPLFIVLLARGQTPPHALGIAVGNVLESLVGVYLLRRIEFNPLLSRLRDAMALILVSLVATLLSATLIALVDYYGGLAAFFSPLWLSIWVAHSVSLLALGPFALYWGNRPFFKKTAREITEGILVFGGIFAIDALASWTHYTAIGPFSIIYILVVFLVWVSLRTGPRGVALSLALTTLVTATGLIFTHGTQAEETQALLQTQVLIGVLSIIFLPFTSIVEERKNAVLNLEDHIHRLQTAVDKIRSEDEAKSDFIAILAHELRNPLSPILSTLELMRQEEQSDSGYVASIASHVHVMARLLDDLLDISRITQKKFKLERTPVELSAVVNHAVEMAKPFMDSRGHQLLISLPQEPVWLDADPVRLEQVFVNILNNAAKYTDPGGEIRLSAAQDDGVVTIRIVDNGVGIEPSRLPHVFDPFGGAEGAARSRGGLRIGLSLAKRMVELHRGTIKAKSAGEGAGSEFVVTLPLPTLSPLPLPAQENRGRSRFSQEELRTHTQGKEPLRVLVVDDNEAAAKSLGALLERNGHPIALAYDGTSGLAKAREWRPEAVLLDIGLPDIDGHEVGRRLRTEYGGSLVIIALTGYGQTEDRQKAILAGFDKHLTKPASIVDVERALGDLRR